MLALTEICRICYKDIKIGELNEHLGFCSKLSSLNQEMKENNEKIEELIVEFKEK